LFRVEEAARASASVVEEVWADSDQIRLPVMHRKREKEGSRM